MNISRVLSRMRFCYWAFLLDHRSQGLYLKFWWAMSWTWSTSTPYFCPFTWGHNKTGTEKSTRSFPYCRMGSAGDSSAGALKSSLFLVCSLQLTSVHSFFFSLLFIFSAVNFFFFFLQVPVSCIPLLLSSLTVLYPEHYEELWPRVFKLLAGTSFLPAAHSNSHLLFRSAGGLLSYPSCYSW